MNVVQYIPYSKEAQIWLLYSCFFIQVKTVIAIVQKKSRKYKLHTAKSAQDSRQPTMAQNQRRTVTTNEPR